MEGSFKPKGSFGIPDEMRQQMEEARKNPAPIPQPPQALQAQPDEAPADAPAPKVDEAQDQEAAYKKAKKELEESLEIMLEEDDIKEYIFKGRLTKEVNVIRGTLKCQFQTLTPDEYMAIDERMAELRDKGKHTQAGLENQQVIITLSYAWLQAAGKPISAKNEPAKREEYIRKMGAHLVDAASARFSEFNTLLKLVMQEKNFVKKS